MHSGRHPRAHSGSPGEPAREGAIGCVPEPSETNQRVIPGCAAMLRLRLQREAAKLGLYSEASNSNLEPIGASWSYPELSCAPIRHTAILHTRACCCVLVRRCLCLHFFCAALVLDKSTVFQASDQAFGFALALLLYACDGTAGRRSGFMATNK